MQVEVESLEDRISESQQKLEKAYQQILLLDQNIRDLEVRYDRAVQNKKNSFRYNLRLKLSVATGVKMMYHHFVSLKADEIRKMRNEQEALESRMQVDNDEDVDFSTEPIITHQGPVTRARGNRQNQSRHITMGFNNAVTNNTGGQGNPHTGQGSSRRRRNRNRNRNRQDNPTT